jgi:hypothetical protein
MVPWCGGSVVELRGCSLAFGRACTFEWFVEDVEIISA